MGDVQGAITAAVAAQRADAASSSGAAGHARPIQSMRGPTYLLPVGIQQPKKLDSRDAGARDVHGGISAAAASAAGGCGLKLETLLDDAHRSQSTARAAVTVSLLALGSAGLAMHESSAHMRAPAERVRNARVLASDPCDIRAPRSPCLHLPRCNAQRLPSHCATLPPLRRETPQSRDAYLFLPVQEACEMGVERFGTRARRRWERRTWPWACDAQKISTQAEKAKVSPCVRHARSRALCVQSACDARLGRTRLGPAATRACGMRPHGQKRSPRSPASSTCPFIAQRLACVRPSRPRAAFACGGV